MKLQRKTILLLFISLILLLLSLLFIVRINEGFKEGGPGESRCIEKCRVECEATPTPTNTPSKTPSNTPSKTPSNTPTKTPSNTPTKTPSNTPSKTPSLTRRPYSYSGTSNVIMKETNNNIVLIWYKPGTYTFTVQYEMPIGFMVVGAGGGGGGGLSFYDSSANLSNGAGGAGGGGGGVIYRNATNYIMAPNTVNITVGDGGSTGSSGSGTDGGTSSIRINNYDICSAPGGKGGGKTLSTNNAVQSNAAIQTSGQNDSNTKYVKSGKGNNGGQRSELGDTKSNPDTIDLFNVIGMKFKVSYGGMGGATLEAGAAYKKNDNDFEALTYNTAYNNTESMGWITYKSGEDATGYGCGGGGGRAKYIPQNTNINGYGTGYGGKGGSGLVIIWFPKYVS